MIGRFERCFICWKKFWQRGESLAYSLYHESQGDCYVETACKKCSKNKKLTEEIMRKEKERKLERELAIQKNAKRNKEVKDLGLKKLSLFK